MKTRNFRVFCFISLSFIASLIILNCSSTKGQKFGPGVNPSLTPQEAVFPHKAIWANPEEHGRFVRKSGITDTSACANACHGDNLEGGSGPSCKKCHEDWPHEDGWRNKENHGKFVIEKGRSRCATKCHGSDFSGGLSEMSCISCHALYPHADNFADAEIHGPKAAGAGKYDCIACHGADLTGGDSGRSCFECHKNYPHNDDWGKKENHGAFAASNGKDACATKCHGADYAGGLSGVSCDKCHTVWPNQHEPDAWSSGEHGKELVELGENACTGCHGDDWNGGVSKISCYECHESLPIHYEEAWATTGHGKYVINNNIKDDFAACKKCHGTELGGTDTAPSCSKSTCHPSYPDKHIPGSWKSYTGHGKYVVVDKGKDKSECQICHGFDYTGGGSGVTCYNDACHKTYPHPMPASVTPGEDFSQWETKDAHMHGAYFVGKESKNNSSCSAEYCHGADLEGNAENGAYSCDACHLKMPHDAAWNHGLASLTQLEECKKCHGAELQGDGKAKSCYECHKEYPEPHESADWKVTFAGHGKYILSDQTTDLKEGCKSCHGADFTGGVSGKTCYNIACHQTFPHMAGWGGSSHGDFVKGLEGDIFAQIKENCQTFNCHGSGGVSNYGVKDCNGAACHPSFPGKHENKAVWKSDEPGGHRKYVFADGTSECEKCHWGNFGGEGDTWACYSCHDPFPHVPEWEHGTQVLLMGEDEEEFDSGAYDNKCSDCHGLAEKPNTRTPSPDAEVVPMGILLSAGESVPRCYNCHYAYPHIGFRDTYHDIYDDTIKFKNCDGVYEYVLDLCWADKGQYGHQKYILNNADFKKYVNSTDGKKITPENEAALEDLIGATVSGSSLPEGCSAENACHKTKRHGPQKTFGYKFCYSTCHSGN